MGIAALIQKATKEIPSKIIKHPVAAATGVGGYFALNKSKQKARNVERSIMNEYLGAPSSKYAGSEFAKFAARKDEGVTKTATLTKTAEYGSEPRMPRSLHDQLAYTPENIVGGAQTQVGKGIINETIGAIKRLLGFSAQTAVDKLTKEPKRKRLLKDLITKDPHVSQYEKERPGEAFQAYTTMRNVAPELSTDPNIVRSYLRNAAMTGGSLDFPTVKSLADAETAVLRARNEGAWGR